MSFKGKKRGYYYKFYANFILILAIPILAIGLIYVQAKTKIQEQIVAASDRTLSSFFFLVDSVVGDVVDTCVSISYNDTSIELLGQFATKDNKPAYHAWKISKILNEYRNEKYHDIFVYFPNNGYVVSGSGSTLKLEEYYKIYYKKYGDYLDEFNQVANCSSKVPKLYSMNGNGQGAFQCVAMRTGYSRDGKKDYVVVAVINRNYMWEIFQSMEEEEGILFILNADNEVKFSSVDQLPVIEAGIYWETMGLYPFEIGGEKYTILSQNSKQLNVKYIYAIPNYCFDNKLREIRLIFGLGVVLSLILGIWSSYRRTVNVYTPIQQMMDNLQKYSSISWKSGNDTEFEFIESLLMKETEEKKALITALNNSKEIRMQKFLLDLLNGNVKKNDESNDIFAENGIYLCSNLFMVSILQIDSKKEIERDMLAFLTENILKDLFEDRYVGELISLKFDRYAVLLNLEEHQEWERMRNRIAESFISLKEQYHLEFTASISSVQEGLRGISIAYKEAELAIRYKYLLGKGIVIEYSSIANREFRYPQNQDFQLSIVIFDFLMEKKCSESSIKQLLDECMKNYGIDENASLEMLECFQFEIFSVFNRVALQEGYWTKEFKDRAVELLRSPSFEMFKNQLIKLLVNYAEKTQENMKQKDVCIQIKEYIDQNYNDNQLSLTMLGDMSGITPYYLSTLFREKYQHTIPEYIAKTRIDHAKALLRNTDESIQVIALKTGFQESNSFIRTFKRMEGITPGVYKNYWLKDSN